MEKNLTDMEVEKVGGSATVYEVSFLLLPSLALEQVPAKAASLKDMLTRVGGEVIGGEDPVLIDLSYPMTKVVGITRHKVNTGYFGWLKFELSKDNIEEGTKEIKKAFDNDPEILRYIIIKTVRENTLLNGKMMLRKEEKKIRDDEPMDEIPEVVKEIVPEELDKSIDDLVIV